jgi:hypothetical protein
MSNLVARTFEVVLRQLEEMPQFLHHSLSYVPEDLMRRKPRDDDMSLIEHLCHVRDCDPDLYALRIRRILTEASPSLDPVDVSVWPVVRAYAAKEGNVVLEEFTQLRADLVEELRALKEDELCRAGRRADGSEITVTGITSGASQAFFGHSW